MRGVLQQHRESLVKQVLRNSIKKAHEYLPPTFVIHDSQVDVDEGDEASTAC